MSPRLFNHDSTLGRSEKLKGQKKKKLRVTFTQHWVWHHGTGGGSGVGEDEKRLVCRPADRAGDLSRALLPGPVRQRSVEVAAGPWVGVEGGEGYR